MVIQREGITRCFLQLKSGEYCTVKKELCDIYLKIWIVKKNREFSMILINKELISLWQKLFSIRKTEEAKGRKTFFHKWWDKVSDALRIARRVSNYKKDINEFVNTFQKNFNSLILNISLRSFYWQFTHNKFYWKHFRLVRDVVRYKIEYMLISRIFLFHSSQTETSWKSLWNLILIWSLLYLWLSIFRSFQSSNSRRSINIYMPFL